MPVAAVILVEPAQAGNLGAVMRVAANLGVPSLELVRPRVDPAHAEVVSWACGGDRLLAVRRHTSLDAAAARYLTLVGTCSGRGRPGQPVVGPRQAAAEIRRRGGQTTALVFGNEATGLSREDLDRCDLVVQVPTRDELPVLNLAQAVAILLGFLALELEDEPALLPLPAAHEQLEALVAHLRSSLIAIGFLDPSNPDRILRKLRRMLARAGVTANEVAILRGMCRQIDWAARRR